METIKAIAPILFVGAWVWLTVFMAHFLGLSGGWMMLSYILFSEVMGLGGFLGLVALCWDK